ncbi:MAG: MarR family transcriptional regulator [Planctomycetales bacterium]|nr:MarR family transcriptional regulator [Planctomycetales bacterium]
MLFYDFENSVGFWLVGAHQAYMRAFNERLAPQGVTFRQAQVLGWLAVEGPQSQADLACRMLIEPPSLVGVLDRMERDGWIERRACPQDRRKKLVAALPAAGRVFKRITQVGREMRAKATAGLTDREVETLRTLLARVQQNVQASEVDCETVGK